MKNICIYHRNCLDGFGAALAVWFSHQMKNEELELMPAHYGDATPYIDTDTNVVIVDFSYPREILIQMHRAAGSVHVIDHHKTAQNELAGLDFCLFDMAKSGSLMAWEHYLPNIPVPPLIKHINDRDLWVFAHGDTKAVTAALMTLPFDIVAWSKWLGDDITPLIEKGRAILDYQHALVDKIASADDIPMLQIAGYTVPCLNATHLISEIGDALSDKYPFVAIYFDTTSERIYSLRSAEDGIDVGEVAKLYGGGGHAHASGFRTGKPSHCLPS